METVGRVKGVSFSQTLERVRDLLASGAVSREALDVQLSPEAAALIDEKVEPSLWYPVATADELSRLLVEIEGGGDVGYMRGLGAQSLSGLLERDSIRSFIEGAMGQRGREGETLVQLASLIYDFGKWSYAGDDLSRFVVTARDVAELREAGMQTVAGFMEELVRRFAGFEVRVTAERPEPDRIVWTAVPA